MKEDLQKAETDYIVKKNLKLFNELKQLSKVELALTVAHRRMKSAEIFISSKEKMHPTGREQFSEAIHMIEDAIQALNEFKSSKDYHAKLTP